MKKILFSILMLFGTSVSAVPLEFSCISGNIAGDCAIGETQLSGELDEGLDTAIFTFYNDGTDAMFIDGAYFYDGDILSTTAVITGSDGVSFSEGASPAHLPSYTGDLTVFYSADADNPAPTYGVDLGEWISFEFDINESFIFDDLLASIEEDVFGFGLKVQGYATGGSETFWGGCPDGICYGEPEDPGNPVPEPGIAALMGIGLLGMVGVRKSRKKNTG